MSAAGHRVAITKAKPRLIELARDVAATGVHVLFTRHGRPIARLIPPLPEDFQQQPEEGKQ